VGTVVGSDYDPMLSKVIGHGASRAAALSALDGALARTVVLGVTTNIEFLRFLLADPDVVAGQLDTGLLDRRLADFAARSGSDDLLLAAAGYRWARDWPTGPAHPWEAPSGWRLGPSAPITLRLTDGTREVEIALTGTPAEATARIDGGEPVSLTVRAEPSGVTAVVAGVRRGYHVADAGDRLWIADGGAVQVIREVVVDRVGGESAGHGETDVRSPMPGTVIAVSVGSGDSVAAGTPLLVVEAMKMEHTLTAPSPGIAEVLVAQGDQVALDQLLVRVRPAEDLESGSGVAESE
jgi:acetyl-CoA/propionyl-CoA carboxylase biotin carboxyl carrier protein